MRKLFVALAALSVASCAEVDGTDPNAETVTTGRAIVVEAEDGTEFEVSIVHGGRVTPVDEVAVLEAIRVVGVTPVEATDVTPVQDDSPGFVLPTNPELMPGRNPVSVYVTGVDPDVFAAQYRWDWLEGVDPDQIEVLIDVLCPPWH